jgi:hypothetical protein
MAPKDFPHLPITTGRYAAEWFVDDRTLPGEVELEAGRPPRLTFFGEVKPLVWRTEGKKWSAGFPQDHALPRIIGRLRNGHDIVVTDADVSVWVPQRSMGLARHAVVGLGISEAKDGHYRRIRLQMTGSDILFGIPPIKAVSFPDPTKVGFEGKIGAEVNSQSVQHWEDPSSSVAVTCSYEGNFSLTNRYRHHLVFAPVVEFEGEPATVDEWMAQWVRPLLGLAALSARSPQRLCWVTLHTGRDERDPESPSRSGVLFGSGISQEPYQADESDKLRDPDRRPLLTFRDLPLGLLVVLAQWRALEASQNPFLGLYRSVLFQPDLPPRARFLYLIQALEGLHAFEHRRADERAQLAFEAKREAILTGLAAADVAVETLRYIKTNWSRRQIDSQVRPVRHLRRGGVARPVRRGRVARRAKEAG